MHDSFARGIIAVIAVATVALMAVLIGGGNLLQAAADNVPGLHDVAAPTPVPTPAIGTVLSTVSPVTPPGADPPWLVAGPSFANSILHWTTTSYVFIPNGQSASNGEIVTGEFWMQVGPDNTILRSHEYFTRADGNFLQEVVYDDGMTTTVWSAGTYPPHPNSRCRLQGTSTPPPGPLGPPFAADPATLAQLGFTPGNDRTEPLPTTPSLPNVEPIAIYPSGESIQGWDRRETLHDGTMLVRQLEIGASGRTVAAEGRRLDESGTVIEETRQTFGTLQVYDPETVPEFVFAITQEVQEACHG